MRDNSILTNKQSGFLPGNLTITQLVDLQYQFGSAINNKQNVIAVFLDIAKAFNTVWHDGLIYKIKKCQVTGSLREWFRSYLYHRQNRATLYGVKSNWSYVNAGIPQGSVRGPLLFLIYINDIVNIIQLCEIRLFADDTLLYLCTDNLKDGEC